MPHIAFRSMLLLVTLGLTMPPVATAEESAAISLEFPLRAIHQASPSDGDGRPSVSSPAAGSLPGLVDLAEFPAEVPVLAVTDALDTAIETRAAVAATWAAQQQFRLHGRQQLYQVGFYESMKLALDDPTIGEWDYQRGYAAGADAPQAVEVGAEMGRQEAEREASVTTEAHVSAVGSGHPTLDPQPPSRAPDTLHSSVENSRLQTPSFFDVFDDNSPTEVLSARDGVVLPSSWTLFRQASAFRQASSADAYDGGWTDGKNALDEWMSHHHDGAIWRQLESSEKSAFSAVFRRIYNRQLGDLFAESAERVYGVGFDDGWKYGTLIAYEWSFRKGYHAGFAGTLSASARAGFEERNSRIYNDLYRERSASTTPSDKAGRRVSSDPALSVNHAVSAVTTPLATPANRTGASMD